MVVRQVKYASGLLFFLSSLLLSSQNLNIGGAFPTLDHSGTLTNKLDYSLYYFAAFPLVNMNTSVADPYFHLLYSEQALSYKLTGKFSITGSYVYQRANVVYDNYVNENRFYLQAKFKHAIQKINLTHRLRFDGRFIQNRLTSKTPFTHRLRYLIGMEIPINEKFYFSAYEEAFFNTFQNPGAVYGENWAYAAFGKKLNERNKLELGILYITWDIGNNNWFNQYYLQITWISHLDLIKRNS